MSGKAMLTAVSSGTTAVPSPTMTRWRSRRFIGMRGRSGDGEAALEPLGHARDRIAVEEEPREEPEIHRHQELGTAVGDEGRAGQGHRLLDAGDRDERRRHGKDGIEV